jgi:rod shape-determining protein MreC
MIDSLHSQWIARIGNRLVLNMVSPIQTASDGAYDGAKNILSIVPDFFRARAENVALKNRVGELEQRVVALTEELRQERRLQELLEYSDSYRDQRVIARVIGTSPSKWFNAILVNKGSVHGIRKHLPVLSSSGLVGHVIEYTDFSSKVLLLTDPNSKVSAIVQEGRAQGVVQGDGESGCVLKYIEPTAHIKTGDLIITSGYSQIYPKGLLIGHIAEIKSAPSNLFQWARVIPQTDFKKLEEVAILMTPQDPLDASIAVSLSQESIGPTPQ